MPIDAEVPMPVAAGRCLLTGATGYVVTGWDKAHLPALSLGYVYLPALVGLVVGAFATVPSGDGEDDPRRPGRRGQPQRGGG